MTVSSIGSTVDALSAKTGQSQTLDESAFLKLMTTQLQTQDPFNPVDNTQMVAQLAQFSSLAGITQMNATLSGIAGQLTSTRFGDAASWIGKKALVASSTATPLSDGSYAGRIALPSDATGVTVRLVDASGNVVSTQDLGPHTAGTVDFAWNGKDATGATLAGGPLTVQVTAAGANGAITASAATWTMIGGVQSPGTGSTMLVTPLGNIDPTDAIQLG